MYTILSAYKCTVLEAEAFECATSLIFKDCVDVLIESLFKK